MELKICKYQETSRDTISIKGELILIEVDEKTDIFLNEKYYKALIVSNDTVDINNLILIDDRTNITDEHQYSIKTVELILNNMIHTVESKYVAYKPEYVKKIVVLPEHFTKDCINEILLGEMNIGDTIYLNIIL